MPKSALEDFSHPADRHTSVVLRGGMFPQQGQFHPLKYLRGLAEASLCQNGKIFTETHVEKFEGGAPASVETSDGHTVTAEALVVATNSPVNAERSRTVWRLGNRRRC